MNHWCSRLPGVLCAAVAVLIASSGGVVAGQAPGASVSTAADVRTVLDQYCVRCHNDRRPSADVSLEGVDLEQVAAHAQTLERAVRKLRAGAMPPRGSARPEPATYAALTRWLETALDEAAAVRPNPGRTEALHRLNRAEYVNVIRDLLALEGLNATTLLPGDDASYGFDNIAGVLGMTSTHLDRYVTAARTVSRLAVGDVTLPPDGETYMLPPDLTQDYRLGGSAVRHAGRHAHTPVLSGRRRLRDSLSGVHRESASRRRRRTSSRSVSTVSGSSTSR